MNAFPRAQTSVHWIWSVILLIVVGAALVLLGLRLMAPKVTVAEVVEGPVVQAFYATGTIQPQRDYPIKTPLAGTITSVRVDKGDRVTASEVLAVVSDPDLAYAASKAKAAYEEKLARADEKSSPVLSAIDARIAATTALLDIAQREEKRIGGLLEKRAASQSDYDNAVDRQKNVWADLESLKSERATTQLTLQRELADAKAALDSANWNLDQQTLKAPIDGVVLDRPLAQGTRVVINDPLMTIADVRPDKLIMRAAVDEEDITSVKTGQVVQMTLYSYEGRTFQGKVRRIYPEADASRRTFEVDVAMDDPDPAMSPGMTGELAFIMQTKESAVVVPSQAVQKGTIYTVRNGRLHKVDSTLGLRGVERTEVTSGLKSGQSVVVSAIGDLAEGQRVRTTRIDPVVAAELNKPKQTTDGFKGFN
jgi:multidrug efflux pump subunit AcrA (membrane-fusion protein)